MNFLQSLFQSLNFTEIRLTRAGFFLTILVALFIVFYVIKVVFIKRGKKLFSFLYSVWKSVKQAVIENPEVKKFADHHKKLFDFLQKRSDKSSFYGLPLTLCFLALLYIVFLFGGIVENVINSDIIVSADIRVAKLLEVFRDADLTKIFFWITLLGKWQIVFVFIIAAVLVLWLWQKRTFIVPLLLCVAGSETFTLAGKLILHRARPDSAVYLEDSFSFPSGHAAIALAFYGFLAYVLIKNTGRWKRKINIFFAAFILIFLIGFSRLYLGVHYVSDIWGGYLAGAIWLIIAVGFSEYFLYKKQKDGGFPLNMAKYLTGIGIVFVSICFYIFFAVTYKIPALTPKEPARVTTSDILTIFKMDQLKYTETLLGNTQEPLSFLIIAKNGEPAVNFMFYPSRGYSGKML